MRSLLFVPGHRAPLHPKALDSDADVVVFDLEDAVPPDARAEARATVASTLSAARRGWVRVNPPESEASELDLAAIARLVEGVRLPKTETAGHVHWARERIPPSVQLICSIESARALENLTAIASAPGVTALSVGGVDLAADLGVGYDSPVLDHAWALVVVASAAAGIEAPIAPVHTLIDDDSGLESVATRARRYGFQGMSAIHPRQLAAINDVFQPTRDERAWANRVLDAWRGSAGHPTVTSAGEFVDPPVVRRAESLLKTSR